MRAGVLLFSATFFLGSLACSESSSDPSGTNNAGSGIGGSGGDSSGSSSVVAGAGARTGEGAVGGGAASGAGSSGAAQGGANAGGGADVDGAESGGTDGGSAESGGTDGGSAESGGTDGGSAALGGAGGSSAASGGAGISGAASGSAGSSSAGSGGVGGIASGGAGTGGTASGAAGTGTGVSGGAGTSGSPSSGGDTSEAGASSGSEAGAPDGGQEISVPANGTITSITTSALTLTPDFSSSIHDYYVRCSVGDNALTLTTIDDNGTTSTALHLIPNQLANVDDQYYIRCLPPDFPSIVARKPGTPTPGYYLVNGGAYAMVFDGNAVPVWYAHGISPINLDTPGTNELSFVLNGATSFNGEIADFFQVNSLDTNLVTEIAVPNSQVDVHELRFLANGDHLIYTNPFKPGVDLTGLAAYGSNETVLDCKINDVDPSGNLVWSWLASDHVDPVYESLEPATQISGSVTLVDTFHCNSIEVDGSGNLLVSMRQTNALFYIDRTSGAVLWKMGGSAYNKDNAELISTHNDPETTFSMQHDARFLANGHVTLFDDHGAGVGVARGVEYAIDHQAGTATPVFQFLGTAAAQYEGSFRRYSDGESVIGWGHVPNDPRIFTEVDSSGTDVFDIALDATVVSYRAIKVPLAQLDIGLMRQTAGR